MNTATATATKAILAFRDTQLPKMSFLGKENVAAARAAFCIGKAKYQLPGPNCRSVPIAAIWASAAAA
jgi:hypothetical protein